MNRCSIALWSFLGPEATLPGEAEAVLACRVISTAFVLGTAGFRSYGRLLFGRKYQYLSKIGNEIRVLAKSKDRKDATDIQKVLNCDDPFKDWKEKIHQKVLDCMADFSNDVGQKKMKKNPTPRTTLYKDGAADLLKLIRNMGEHFNEKSTE
ncbi:2-5A-dependent ribonuclease [Varanus komodoensis]|nr:2-5A-dependent ribonuclease [Varanus komodoensis]